MPEEREPGEEGGKPEAVAPKIPGIPKVPGVEGAEDLDKVGRLLESVADMVEDLADTLGKIVDKLAESLDGAKVGREVAEFYRQLKESGVPDEVAIELTKEFFEKRTKIAEELVKSLRAIFE